MRRMLFLSHRIPYPPDKGDKIRAWHMLNHLSRGWEIDLGCLVDDPKDMSYLPVLESRCHTVRAYTTGSSWQSAIRALSRCRPGQPLTAGWFHHDALARWVREGLSAGCYDAVFAYSAAMAPYVMGHEGKGLRRILDLVDVDSEKWRSYAQGARMPMRYVWSREARTLLSFERRAAMAFDQCLFVSKEEGIQFSALAPETRGKIDWVENGVDMSFFDTGRSYENPYGNAGRVAVFTGTMDYRPNVEAVCWFAREILPKIRAAGVSDLQFFIVGANPSTTVRALNEAPGVHVTGAVPDIRPYIAHADVVVAPLHIARGIQNKVLEAMALARPVVATSAAFEGIHAVPGRDLLVADGIESTTRSVLDILNGGHPDLGAMARQAMAQNHDWVATLKRLDALLEPAVAQERSHVGAVA